MRDIPGAFERLLSEMEVSVRQAFLDAIANIRTTARLRNIEALLEQEDIQGLLDALNLSPDYFVAVRDAVESAFNAGGQHQVSLGVSLSSIPFDRRHWAAEAWAREYGSRLIAEISEATREGVRKYVEEAIRTGRGSNITAREVVGKVSRSTGRREGGIIGLTGREAGYVANARRELERLDPAFLRRVARDRRYDSIIRKAIEARKPLAKADIERIIGRYSDGLLIRRGDRIARTEAHNALNAGRYEAMRQTAEKIGLDETAITVKWQAARDERVRHSHRGLNGESVGYGEAFVSPLGSRMRSPGDREYGAMSADIVNCRCTLSFAIGD